MVEILQNYLGKLTQQEYDVRLEIVCVCVFVCVREKKGDREERDMVAILGKYQNHK